MYDGIPELLHLALCCFMKSSLEAIAESIDSVINSHGCENRIYLLPSSGMIVQQTRLLMSQLIHILKKTRLVLGSMFRV